MGQTNIYIYEYIYYMMDIEFDYVKYSKVYNRLFF